MPTLTKDRTMPSRATSALPANAARDLGRLSRALQALAAELPGRTSVRQAMAFVTIAQLDAMGHSVTLTDLRETLGEDLEGAPLLGQSVERILNTFLEPTKRDPDGLGWVYQENDEDDRRRKYLKLTDEGRGAAKRIMEALGLGKEAQ